MSIAASHSELYRTSRWSLSGSKMRCACSTYVVACASISSPLRAGRVAVLPLGSPTRAVKSPMMSTAT